MVWNSMMKWGEMTILWRRNHDMILLETRLNKPRFFIAVRCVMDIVNETG